MPIVTISREYGAGGSSVARLVAAGMGAEVVDKYLVDEVAKRLAMTPGEVESESERPRTLLDRIARSMASLEPALGAGWMPPFPDPLYDPRKEIVALTEKVIHEAAATGNVVVVGRGAGFVLRDDSRALRVFLAAPADVRAKVVMARDGVAEKRARQRMHETDSNRAAYIRQLCGRDWRDPCCYDLMVNTGRIGHEAAARMILDAVRAA